MPHDPDQPLRLHDTTADGSAAATVREGDVRAFEALFREHYAALCRFATHLVSDPAQAEDLVQSVFTTIWANRTTWIVEQSERAYLFTAVRNAAYNHSQRLSVRRHWEERMSSSDEHVAPEKPDEVMERAETAARVQQALATLPARCRMVMELRWREQMSYAEIAKVMGISVKGVENQLARGLSRMKEVWAP